MQIKFKFIESLNNLVLQNIAIANGDTILAAMGKLQGQINEQVNLTGTQTIAGSKTFTAANTVFANDLTVNGGDITTTATTFNVASTATTLQIGAGTATLRLGSFVGIGTSGNANNSLNISGNFTGNAARSGLNQATTITSEPLTLGRAHRGYSGILSNLVTNTDRAGQTIALDGVLYTAQNGTVDATQDVYVTTLTGGRFIGIERSASTVPIPSVTGIQGNASHRGSATTVDSFGARSFVVTESAFTGTINNAHGYFAQVVNNAGSIDTAYGVRNVFSGPVAIPQIIGFFNDLSGVQTTTLDFAAEAGQTLKIGHWNTASKVAQVDLTFAANGAATFTQSVTAPSFVGPLTGNASTASVLQTPRTIALAGDVTGSAEFDGSQNITINTVSAGGGGGTPTLIEMGMTFKVGKNIQALFTEEIELEQDAEIECDENAVLVEVN